MAKDDLRYLSPAYAQLYEILRHGMLCLTSMLRNHASTEKETISFECKLLGRNCQISPEWAFPCAQEFKLRAASVLNRADRVVRLRSSRSLSEH